MFAHPIMLAGIGGAMLPLALHLLNRARYRNIRWGAMMFLASSNDGNWDALARLRVPLILLVRMGIVALLAMALARPFVHSASDSRLCVIVLFDNGPGMSFDEGTAGTRIETARATALSIVNQLQREDEVHVVLLAGEQNNSEATDLQSAVSQIADIRMSANRADIADGFNNAARMLARSEIPRKAVILLADREAVTWRGMNEVFAATFRQQMLTYGNNLQMLFVPIGSESDENVAIDRIQLPPPPLIQGGTITAQVVVHNDGSTPLSVVPIEMRVVGQRSGERKTIDLPAGGVVSVDFPLSATSTGYYLARARIADDAKIPGGVTFDDQAEAVAHVVDAIPVLIVADRTSDGATTTATTTAALQQEDIIATALSPFARGGGEGADSANVKMVSSESPWWNELAKETVLIWCARRSPTVAESEQLKTFATSGGGVLVLPGAGEVASINSLFDGTAGLSPVSLRSQPATHPVTQAALRPSPLLLTPLFRRQQLLSASQAARSIDGLTIENLAPIERYSTDAEVLAQTIDGHSWLIGKPLGKGRVLVATSSADGLSGSFAERPAFVQLMRELLCWLAVGKADRCNLNAGEPFELHDLPASSKSALVTLPNETHQRLNFLQTNDSPALRFSKTFAAGRYQIDLETTDGTQAIPFVVRPARDASDLTPTPSQRLNRIEQIANLLPVNVRSGAEIVSRLNRDVPYDLWLPLLAGVIGLVLIDLWLSNYFSNRFSANRLAANRFSDVVA